MQDKELTHNELVIENMLQILEERYANMDKKEKDAVIMLIIESTIKQ